MSAAYLSVCLSVFMNTPKYIYCYYLIFFLSLIWFIAIFGFTALNVDMLFMGFSIIGNYIIPKVLNGLVVNKLISQITDCSLKH